MAFATTLATLAICDNPKIMPEMFANFLDHFPMIFFWQIMSDLTTCHMVEIVSTYLVAIVINLTIIDLVSSSLSLGTWNKDNKKKEDHNKGAQKKYDQSLVNHKKITPKNPRPTKNYILKKISFVICLYNF